MIQQEEAKFWIRKFKRSTVYRITPTDRIHLKLLHTNRVCVRVYASVCMCRLNCNFQSTVYKCRQILQLGTAATFALLLDVLKML